MKKRFGKGKKGGESCLGEKGIFREIATQVSKREPSLIDFFSKTAVVIHIFGCVDHLCNLVRKAVLDRHRVVVSDEVDVTRWTASALDTVCMYNFYGEAKVSQNFLQRLGGSSYPELSVARRQTAEFVLVIDVRKDVSHRMELMLLSNELLDCCPLGPHHLLLKFRRGWTDETVYWHWAYADRIDQTPKKATIIEIFPEEKKKNKSFVTSGAESTIRYVEKKFETRKKREKSRAGRNVHRTIGMGNEPITTRKMYHTGKVKTQVSDDIRGEGLPNCIVYKEDLGASDVVTLEMLDVFFGKKESNDATYEAAQKLFHDRQTLEKALHLQATFARALPKVGVEPVAIPSNVKDCVMDLYLSLNAFKGVRRNRPNGNPHADAQYVKKFGRCFIFEHANLINLKAKPYESAYKDCGSNWLACIKDLEAKIAHCCKPIMGLDDNNRYCDQMLMISNRADVSEKFKRELEDDLITGRMNYICDKPSQFCDKKAEVGIFDHVYDMSTIDIADAMDKMGARHGYISLALPELVMASCSYKEHLPVSGMTFTRERLSSTRSRLICSFPGGDKDYVHDFEALRDVVTKKIYVSTDGVAYSISRLKEVRFNGISELVIFHINRIVGPIPRSTVFRTIMNASRELAIIKVLVPKLRQNRGAFSSAAYTYVPYCVRVPNKVVQGAVKNMVSSVKLDQLTYQRTYDQLNMRGKYNVTTGGVAYESMEISSDDLGWVAVAVYIVVMRLRCAMSNEVAQLMKQVRVVNEQANTATFRLAYRGVLQSLKFWQRKVSVDAAAEDVRGPQMPLSTLAINYLCGALDNIGIIAPFGAYHREEVKVDVDVEGMVTPCFVNGLSYITEPNEPPPQFDRAPLERDTEGNYTDDKVDISDAPDADGVSAEYVDMQDHIPTNLNAQFNGRRIHDYTQVSKNVCLFQSCLIAMGYTVTEDMLSVHLNNFEQFLRVHGDNTLADQIASRIGATSQLIGQYARYIKCRVIIKSEVQDRVYTPQEFHKTLCLQELKQPNSNTLTHIKPYVYDCEYEPEIYAQPVCRLPEFLKDADLFRLEQRLRSVDADIEMIRRLGEFEDVDFFVGGKSDLLTTARRLMKGRFTTLSDKSRYRLPRDMTGRQGVITDYRYRYEDRRHVKDIASDSKAGLVVFDLDPEVCYPMELFFTAIVRTQTEPVVLFRISHYFDKNIPNVEIIHQLFDDVKTYQFDEYQKTVGEAYILCKNLSSDRCHIAAAMYNYLNESDCAFVQDILDKSVAADRYSPFGIVTTHLVENHQNFRFVNGTCNPIAQGLYVRHRIRSEAHMDMYDSLSDFFLAVARSEVMYDKGTELSQDVTLATNVTMSNLYKALLWVLDNHKAKSTPMVYRGYCTDETDLFCHDNLKLVDTQDIVAHTLILATSDHIEMAQRMRTGASLLALDVSHDTALSSMFQRVEFLEKEGVLMAMCKGKGVNTVAFHDDVVYETSYFTSIDHVRQEFVDSPFFVKCTQEPDQVFINDKGYPLEIIIKNDECHLSKCSWSDLIVRVNFSKNEMVVREGNRVFITLVKYDMLRLAQLTMYVAKQGAHVRYESSVPHHSDEDFAMTQRYADGKFVVVRKTSSDENMGYDKIVRLPDTANVVQAVMCELNPHIDIASLTPCFSTFAVRALMEFESVSTVLHRMQSRTFAEIAQAHALGDVSALKLHNDVIKDYGRITRYGVIDKRTTGLKDIYVAYANDESYKIQYDEANDRYEISGVIPDHITHLFISYYARHDNHMICAAYARRALESVAEVGVRVLDAKIVRQNVAGAGKTRYIIDEFMAEDKENNHVVLTDTNNQKKEILQRYKKAYGRDSYAVTLTQFMVRSERSQYDLSEQRTIRKYINVAVDEANAQHAGAIVAVIQLQKARKVVLVGDKEQLPYFFPSPQKGKVHYQRVMTDGSWQDSQNGRVFIPSVPRTGVFDETVVGNNVSFRVTSKACALNEGVYSEGFYTYNDEDNILESTIVPNAEEFIESQKFRDAINKQASGRDNHMLVITWTNAEAEELKKIITRVYPDQVQHLRILAEERKEDHALSYTVRKAQGGEAVVVFHIRTSQIELNHMVQDKSFRLVATTRHRKEYYYVVMKSDDLYEKIQQQKLAIANGTLDHKRFIRSKQVAQGDDRQLGRDVVDTVESMDCRYLEHIFESPLRNPPANYVYRNIQTLAQARRLPSESMIKVEDFDQSERLKILKFIQEQWKRGKKIWIQFSNDIEEEQYRKCCESNDNIILSEETSIGIRALPHHEVAEPQTDYSNMVEYNDTTDIELVQSMHNHNYPDCDVLHNMPFASQNGPLVLTTDNIVAGDMVNDPKEMTFKPLIPQLQTKISPPTRNALHELWRGLNARNLQVPVALDDFHASIDPRVIARDLMERFDAAYLRKLPRDVRLMNSHAGIYDWVKSASSNTVSKCLLEMFHLIERERNAVEVSLKKNAKPDMKPGTQYKYSPPQVIGESDKTIIQSMGHLMQQLMELIIAVLPANVCINTRKTRRQLESWLNGRNIRRVFSTIENDMSKYDKAQQDIAKWLAIFILQRFGFPEYIVKWLEGYFSFVILRSREHRFRVKIGAQRRSGDIFTLSMNTFLLMATTAAVCDIESCDAAMFVGDDSLIINGMMLPDSDSTFAWVYNLEAKLLPTFKVCNYRYRNTKGIMFCSMFLFFIEGSGWVFVPCPLKLFLKLGQMGVYTRKKLEEIRISYADNYELLKKFEIQLCLDQVVNARYGTSFDMEYITRFVVEYVYDVEKFQSLWLDPDGPMMPDNADHPDVDY